MNNVTRVEQLHVPVMLDRCLDLLSPGASRPGAVVIDATLGLGGHTEAMLRRFPDVRVIGFDRDSEALARSQARLAPFGDRVIYCHDTYDGIAENLERLDIPAVDGVLYDLGVSSMQLDFAERGFAYSLDAPLDMRMSQADELTAAEIVNTYSVGDLTRIFAHYGEEKFAHRVALAITKLREHSPIETTGELAEIIKDAIPAAARRTGGHPAKRVFQALRIEVNAELSVLENSLPQALSALAVGGRVVVMSYQSLEDRIVKQIFTEATTTDIPVDLPFVPEGSEAKFKLVFKGSEKPSEAELAMNSRSQAARLRAIERVRPA
jgi:16S rRNA (cytosine1402-N4)-methyltransferase